MELDALLATVPDYATDLKLNLQNVLRQVELTPQQAWGTAVASAIATRNAALTRTLMDEAAKHISPEAVSGAKAAAAIMGMNNIYYRFLHLSSNEKYRTIPARLRMQVIRAHGTDPVDFELWCTAVSAINGCGACVDSHENVLREKGVSEEIILAVIRIASVVHALGPVFEAEQA